MSPSTTRPPRRRTSSPRASSPTSSAFSRGIPTAPTSPSPTPPQILLYLTSLWEFSGEDPEIFRDEVRVTYLHELGHYLGWGEDDLAQRGLD